MATPSAVVFEATATVPAISQTVQPPTSTSPASAEPLPASPPPATPTGTPETTTLLFTGNIVPARCVQAKIDEIGDPDYPYEEVRDLIQGVDLAIGTLNATLSDFTEPTGCVGTFLLVGRAANAEALGVAGFDAMSVATNHIKNCGQSRCGDRAFLETLKNLELAGVRPIGAGDNLAEALAPQVFTLNGVRFAFISLGELESTTFATDSSPGIAVLNEENLRSAIAAARAVGDVVIALPHWGPEYSLAPNYRQLLFAEIAVDAGADLVVGNHTHTVQALETINEVPVFYGLGNFMFDQSWSRETAQGVALIATFTGRAFTGFELIPVHIAGDGRVQLANTEEAVEILGRIQEASQSLP
jgi:poly-gamma-glutamate synthesis protein (capsule biosynthesis protein)